MKNLSNYKIRQAKVDEAEYLSDLALRSKAIWGYSKDFIIACKPHIKVDREYIEAWPVKVLDKQDEIIGFYSLKIINGENRLDNLWIEPRYIRYGYGTILFKNAIDEAKKLEWNYFRLAGEPGAVPFYEKHGAKLVGKVQSRLKKDLFLPHMEIKF